MPTPSQAPTATFAAPSAGATAAAPAAVGDAGFDEELRRLLRSRLLLVHALFFTFLGLLAVLIPLIPVNEHERSVSFRASFLWVLVVPLAECVAGILVLWRCQGLRLRSLRVLEFICFGTHAACAGVDRFEVLATVGATGEVPNAVFGFAGLTTLQMFVVLILAYGVLVPNTRRRTMVVIAALAAIPFATIPMAMAVNPALSSGHAVAHVGQCAFILSFPAGLAVFAASRAHALQRRAFEAERRAEQVGQYALRRKLGEGGMGEVWLAEHRLLKRPCAVKFVRPELAASPAVAARFAREVQAVTGLTHANTVRVYDYGRADDGSFFYVMEYLAGPTLDQMVRDHGPLPPGRAVYLLAQLCGALAEAHAAGLVHRDLKPGNVIVTAAGGQRDVAKLVDFGLVADESAAGGDDRLTRTGAVMGTPAYMPPEQAAGDPVDARGDVYGLGAVAYFALTGRPPHGGKTARQTLAAVLSEPIPAVDGVPADLAAVVGRCLARDPADRFPRIADVGVALDGCGCAGDWSAERAAIWWSTAPSLSAAPSAGSPTRTAG